jgi:hypothetical protein
LLSLPETVGFEVCGVAGVRVLIHIIELLRRRRHTQLRHGGGVLRLVLLADVIRYRDGGEYPDDNDDRIVAKLQTQGNSDFVLYSPRGASTS